MKANNFTRDHTKTYKTNDDWILEEVSEALKYHPKIDSLGIEVSVDDGCVHLQGYVENQHESNLAESLAESVFGVLGVDNELEIRPYEGQVMRIPRPFVKGTEYH